MIEELNDEQESGFVMRESEVETAEGTARLRYVVCEPLEEAGFLNAFSTRLGGVSPLPQSALNLAGFKNDARENVEENRRRFLKAISAEGLLIVTTQQTHSINRTTIKSTADAHHSQADCDAMISKLRGVLLGVQTADCLPVLIGDPVTGTMAAIHAGWRGTAGRIVERTLADLMTVQGVNLRNCIAALGPTASAEQYEVGEEVIERYKKEFGYWKKLLVNFKANGKAHLDIRAANAQQLAYCGITEERIFIAPYCTMTENDLFFSYRKEAGGQPAKVGRLLSVIGRMG